MNSKQLMIIYNFLLIYRDNQKNHYQAQFLVLFLHNFLNNLLIKNQNQ